MGKLNWYNLKNNKCPQCNRDIIKGLKTFPINDGDGNMVQTLQHFCGFTISEKKYNEIVADIITKGLNGLTI